MKKGSVVLYARIDPELFELVENEAKKEFRSVNKQVEMILTKYFKVKGAQNVEGE